MSHSNETLVNSIANFSLNCLMQLKSNDEYTVFSPMSLIVALSMAYSGAKDKTKQEFLKILNVKNENNEIHEHFFDLIKSSKEIPQYIELIVKMANKIYIKNDFEILESYKNLLSKYYDGQFESIDFNQSVNAANKINSFVSEATNDKIKDIISSDAISGMTRIILVNCLYFSGEWRKAFKDYNTCEDFFYKNENSSKKINFMKQTEFHMFSENEVAQLVTLDYTYDKFKFGILLPKKKYDISNVLNELSGEKLLNLINNASCQSVEITIPKLKIESTFNLNDCLKTLGLKYGFSGEANFSGITENGQLFISNVVQKVFIDVNEKGTEAAAATGVMIELLSAIQTPENPIIFKADHPFFFFILYDNKHILFNGIYM